MNLSEQAMHIDPASLFGNSGRRADAAREALQLHYDFGDPFALYLSRWEPITINYGDEARYMAYGEESQAPEPIADKLGRYLLGLCIPLLMVADDRDVASMASWIPALHLPDHEWHREVHALIQRADLIFIQMLLTTSVGLESEFDLIRAESTHLIHRGRRRNPQRRCQVLDSSVVNRKRPAKGGEPCG